MRCDVRRNAGCFEVECGEQSDMVDESRNYQKERSDNVGSSGTRGWSLFLSYSTTRIAPGTLERGARNKSFSCIS